ncbi:apoptosis inhibitor [Murmansk poxvirus]|uniref:Apoptosis inhibitor n=1 Tax=Murmansk poxvirus TaxID=2025359 RepID=A0A223FMM0_9POXV|nr:apoptosis inhibitor [Murmansk poxvirus]AST09229.1 apoptosis inhibitor [Murmansk poxvirus]
MNDSQVVAEKEDLSKAIKYYINKQMLDNEFKSLSSSSKEFLKVISKKCNKINTDYRWDICDYIDSAHISVDELVSEINNTIRDNESSIGIRLASISLISKMCDKWGQCQNTQDLIYRMSDSISDNKAFIKYIQLVQSYNTTQKYILGSCILGGILVACKVFNFL